jgi:hypothetical protein
MLMAAVWHSTPHGPRNGGVVHGGVGPVGMAHGFPWWMVEDGGPEETAAAVVPTVIRWCGSSDYT